MSLGTFISPDPELENLADPAAKLGIPLFSGYRAIDDGAYFRGRNRIFDDILSRMAALDLPCEDQCSSLY